MQFSGIEIILDNIEKRGIKFKNLNALEVFGRAGNWHTTSYANKVNSLEVWEIDSQWKTALEKNLPNAKIRFIDSIKTLAENTSLTKYDLVVIDNPQNLFGSSEQNKDEPMYCEHFEVLENIGKIIDDGIVIFNVNPIPYNYENFPNWKKRREKFYGKIGTDTLKIEFLTSFYEKFFQDNKFEVLFHTYAKRTTPNPIEVLYYFAYFIKKK